MKLDRYWIFVSLSAPAHFIRDLRAAQFREMEAELSRRRDECSELRNVLVNNTEDFKSIAKTNYSPDADLESINEDGELVLALESQKKINRCVCV